ncbi:MAG: hypothetical protein J6V54_01205 [Bacteroidales bacterium]|nr:hypothetical protein [Bacteroidales bacterium]
MKVKVLLLGMVTSLASIFAEAKDTTYVSRQLLGDDIRTIVVDDYSRVEITQGDSNCVFYFTNKKSRAQSAICEVDGDILRVLKQNTGTVRLVLRDDIEEMDLKRYSKVNVNGEYFFRRRNSIIRMESYAELQFHNKLYANNITFDMESLSTIQVSNISVDKLILKAESYSTILIDNGFINDIETKGSADDIRASIDTKPKSLSKVSLVGDAVNASSTLSDILIKNKMDKKRHGYWSTEFTFGWGSQDWSGAPFMKGSIPYNYSISYGTAYVLELKARYTLAGNRLSVDFGIGYESDVLQFIDGIYYDNGFNGTNDMEYITNENMGSDGAYVSVSSKMVARYITLPFMVNMKFNSLFYGAGFIGGLNYNNKHTGIKETMSTLDFNDGEYSDIYSQSSYAHYAPFKLDFRAVFGFKNFHAFFQTGLVSMLDKVDAYPYRIGMMISF